MGRLGSIEFEMGQNETGRSTGTPLPKPFQNNSNIAGVTSLRLLIFLRRLAPCRPQAMERHRVAAVAAQIKILQVAVVAGQDQGIVLFIKARQQGADQGVQCT